LLTRKLGPTGNDGLPSAIECGNQGANGVRSKYAGVYMIVKERHDEMATPSKPAQKTARAVEGPRAGAAGNQARVHGERRRGAELDRDL
jgi:hypothetical protein